MPSRLFLLLVILLTLPDVLRAQRIEHTETPQTWTLTSGPVTYRLALNEEQLFVDYFGPASGLAAYDPSRPRHFDQNGLANGQALLPPQFELTGFQTATPREGVQQLDIGMRHRRLPLDILIRYNVYGETGVITRDVEYANRGTEPIALENIPTIQLDLPPGEYTMRYLFGGWGQEKQLATERLPATGQRRFEQATGRSTNYYNPWISLRNESQHIEYIAELLYSGNWWMQLERLPGGAQSTPPDREVRLALGMRNDFGGSLQLAPGQSFHLPAVAMTASSGDFDDATNQMHRYQRQFVFPRDNPNRPLLVHYNTWYPFGQEIDLEKAKQAADAAAAIGSEAFVIDSGWYVRNDWSLELGDYQVNREKFPNGLREIGDYVRSKGMKFGLWVEIENVGLRSNLFREHPDWCMPYEGKPYLAGQRCQLDFAKPEVRAWARQTVDRLVETAGLEWIKIDYNIDVGDRFDPTGPDRSGDRLYRHIMAYYDWLDELRAAHPNLIIENCSSGALRFDTAIMGHTHLTWVSDVVNPVQSLSLRYGCTVQFSPEVCNHWMVGEKDSGVIDPSGDPGWWDFMFQVAMNGSFGISSRAWEWPQPLKDRAAANVALYKRIRDVIAGADVYHLTPMPDPNHPTGWMALQYVNDGGRRSVLTAFRLPDSPASQTFNLRGLLPGATYRISSEGKTLAEATGAALASGYTITLPTEWRSTVLELEVKP